METNKQLAASRNMPATASTEEGQRYRFAQLALPLVLSDMYFRRGDPSPGARVPDFDLPVVGGGRFRSGDLGEKGPALMVFGSSTCPVTDNAAPGLRELHARFGDRVRFVMVNVREAHPGASFPQPATSQQKMGSAERLRALHGFEFEVAVDDIDGTLHRALSPKPNSAYVLGQDGTIVFRAHWANDTEGLAEALSAVSAGQRPARAESRGIMRAMMKMIRHVADALDRAGSGAWRDMWRVAAPLAVIALLLKTLGVRAPRPLPAGTFRRAATEKPR